MPTSREIVAELRRFGYDGPVSYSKPKLQAILDHERGVARHEETQQQAETVAEQHGAASKGAVPDIDQAGWCGLLPESLVAISDEKPGWKYRFVSYEAPEGKKPYVVVKAFRRKQIKMRYFAPERILNPKTKEPVTHA